MALVNILAKSDLPIDWESLLHKYSYLDFSHIEIFPIPKELGFDLDSIGINAHRGYTDKEIVMVELKKSFDFFSLHKFKLIELYDGIELNANNFIPVMNTLLSE